MRDRDILAYIFGAVYFIGVAILPPYILSLLRISEGMTDIFIRGFPVYIGILPIVIPIPMSGTSLALILIGIFAAMTIYDTVREVDGDRPITKVFLLGSATLVAVLLMEWLQSSVGIETGMLEIESNYTFMLSAMQATIAEEIGFRVMVIGVISALLLEQGGGHNLVKALLHPYSAHGDPSKIRILYIVVAIQAFLFGLAHPLAGSGWDVGKISTATLAGIYLGHLYIRYGFSSAVLGHAFFNVYLLSIGFATEPGINVNPAVTLYTLLIFIATLAIGGIYLIYLAYKTVVNRVGEAQAEQLPDMPRL